MYCINKFNLSIIYFRNHTHTLYVKKKYFWIYWNKSRLGNWSCHEVTCLQTFWM